jgi:hypothetical protein
MTHDLNGYDWYEEQKEAGQCLKPQRLFELWDRACTAYDKGLINKHQLEEFKAVHDAQLEKLEATKKAINSKASSDEEQQTTQTPIGATDSVY